ncbi:MAG: hypothetical protein CVT79_14770 [Alphaproteobacteria bacterium HGW-Alphaproteobacteria-18]|nr:MAG: hypothetical protein CVT79_14770 [Alphaproteobacteria bacterium HGW-Alphaproteobacteria-18]
MPPRASIRIIKIDDVLAPDAFRIRLALLRKASFWASFWAMMPWPYPSSLEARVAAARNVILETISAPARWNAALAAFAEACGGRSGQIIALNGQGDVVLHRLTETPEDFIRDVEAFGLTDVTANPRLRIGRAAPVMVPRADQDFVSPEERARAPIYTEMFEPHGFAHNCQIVLMRGPDILVRASVSRTTRQGVFDPAAFQAFMALAPYLQAAVKSRIALGLAQVQSTLATLDAVSAAAFLLSVDGRVIGASARAGGMAERGEGLRISRGRLKLAEAAAQEALDTWLRRLPSGRAAPVAVAVGPCILDLQPLPVERSGLGTGPAALAILREAATADEREAVLRMRYGLTQAEAAIARALSGGMSVEMIASMRKVSLPTVRSQLQAIYTKLGVRRQAQLVARLKERLTPPL